MPQCYARPVKAFCLESENKTHESYWMTLKVNGTWVNGEVYVDKPNVIGKGEGRNRNGSLLYAGILWKGRGF
jgi:hypothetical protein